MTRKTTLRVDSTRRDVRVWSGDFSASRCLLFAGGLNIIVRRRRRRLLVEPVETTCYKRASGPRQRIRRRRPIRAGERRKPGAGGRPAAYMKSEMPYYGITSPELTALLRPFVRAVPAGHGAEWEATVLELWDNATHREERYAALALARARVAHQWYDPEVLPLFRHLVVTGAWWDFVDVIAAHLVGEVLARHREAVTPVMREWSVAHEQVEDLWVRRTAVLSQLRHKDSTDRELLHDVIENNLDDRFVLASQGHRLVAARVRSHGSRLGGGRG